MSSTEWEAGDPDFSVLKVPVRHLPQEHILAAVCKHCGCMVVDKPKHREVCPK